jgi:zinc and cadmium transporter
LGTWNEFTGGALAFSAGTFLSIALGDLMPELRFHRHDRWRLSVALLAGVAVMYGSAKLER